MSSNPVVRNTAYCLAHVPDLVRYGSKPRREIEKDPGLAPALADATRPFDAVAAYPPNQVYVGRLSPDELAAMPRPWFESAAAGDGSVDGTGPFGEVVHWGAALLAATTRRARRLGIDAGDVVAGREQRFQGWNREFGRAKKSEVQGIGHGRGPMVTARRRFRPPPSAASVCASCAE